ncbi:hypothetical protein SAMN05660860_03058 [Geoalkalibacter ferrihydriticus]|uniref:Uncharacterized protein n=2 Tax=Geoalkalibacter ferrihydriticus TaxID=392333 RepID=A0A0C2DQI5_9BACT|nr:hypothetical protein [Geoalkalibacter ferrihydriticus]KIH75669.1 hypothetical protein GFER_15175 [Geoalkalibacter ferrihydriticus DSM 17813]SDM72610.1 hypothetical protein SAMN05660860_03058 [Geoalkalibacter ferrihydriticus]
MTPAKESEQSYNECTNAQQHREHLCILMEQGRSREVSERSTHPAFACRNCGAYANEAQDLCNPMSL